MAGGFECSFLELDVIGDALQLDVRPFPFEFPIHGDLIEDRVRLIQVAQQTLTAKGLINGPRFADVVEDTLGVFARGHLAIAMLGTVAGEPTCARAVTDGRTAVLAIQHGQAIRFDPITPPSMVRAVLSLLPPAHPGPGQSVSMTTEPPAGARRPTSDDEVAGSYLQASRVPGDSTGVQRAMIDEIMRRPRAGSGYFAVTIRGRHARESTPLTMNWLDTDSGRYVVIPNTAADGRTHITYTPADQARLEQSLSHLVRTVA
jgi:ESX secretion-associated protein EspG